METDGEQVSDNVIDDSEAQTEATSPLPSPPPPPRLRPAYQTCNIITDDVEGVDTELYYSDTKPEDEDKEDIDVNRSSGFPVDNLTDKIDLTPISSNALNHPDHESGVKVDLTTTNMCVKDGT